MRLYLRTEREREREREREMSFLSLAIQRRPRPLLIFLRGFRVACLASRAKEHRDRDRACSITFERPFAITRRSSRTELIVTRVRVRHREDGEPSRQREVFAGNIRARTRGYDRPYRPRANRLTARYAIAIRRSRELVSPAFPETADIALTERDRGATISIHARSMAACLGSSKLVRRSANCFAEKLEQSALRCRVLD